MTHAIYLTTVGVSLTYIPSLPRLTPSHRSAYHAELQIICLSICIPPQPSPRYYGPIAPTLLFIHGFPSTSYDWTRQIKHFQPKGYGIIAPDLLGYGDLVDILDAEHVDKTIGIGHDWGSLLLSRVALLYPERFHGFAFLALSYLPPQATEFNLDAMNAFLKQATGYETYAYWVLFNREDAHEIIEKHPDSFLQLLYPKDPQMWFTGMSTSGKTLEWVEGNTQPGKADYLTQEEYDLIRKNLFDGGLRSPLNWYKCWIRNHNLDDNKKIPESAYKLQKPSFFAAATKDAVCSAVHGKATMTQFSSDVKIVDFDVGHWVQFEATEALNKELEVWFEALPLN
ncbi:Bifunctional epoxide hydrolase 2 [Grifola frondosa]|uniref:Bifunctional epoxide hydrolase 2 n=1 Tax=Grifola frondosa TaxID=5627 RepID=A0A1C7M038_GRIFR|nr:Bifunctional epoxide hydrolase 2 [Grifola frondosa]